MDVDAEDIGIVDGGVEISHSRNNCVEIRMSRIIFFRRLLHERFYVKYEVEKNKEMTTVGFWVAKIRNPRKLFYTVTKIGEKVIHFTENVTLTAQRMEFKIMGKT